MRCCVCVVVLFFHLILDVCCAYKLEHLASQLVDEVGADDGDINDLFEEVVPLNTKRKHAEVKIFSAVTKTAEKKPVIIEQADASTKDAHTVFRRLADKCTAAQKIHEDLKKSSGSHASHGTKKFTNCLQRCDSNKFVVFDNMGQPVSKLAEDISEPTQRTNFAETIARQLVEIEEVMAAQQFSHGDISASNLMCKSDGGDKSGENPNGEKHYIIHGCAMIDFDKVKFTRPDYAGDMIGMGATVFEVACGSSELAKVENGISGSAEEVQSALKVFCGKEHKLTDTLLKFLVKTLSSDQYVPKSNLQDLDSLTASAGSEDSQFNKLDANHNGVISRDEFEKGMKGKDGNGNSGSECKITGYSDLKEIHSNDLSVIYTATQDKDGQSVVLKKARNQAGNHRLKDECEVAKVIQKKGETDRFEHCLHFGEEENGYSVFNLMGKPAKGLAESQDNRMTFAEDVAKQLLEIARFMEENKFSHGDISPSNVFCLADPSGQHRCGLIDLEAVSLDRAEYAKDLLGIGYTVFSLACGSGDERISGGVSGKAENVTAEIKAACASKEPLTPMLLKYLTEALSVDLFSTSSQLAVLDAVVKGEQVQVGVPGEGKGGVPAAIPNFDGYTNVKLVREGKHSRVFSASKAEGEGQVTIHMASSVEYTSKIYDECDNANKLTDALSHAAPFAKCLERAKTGGQVYVVFEYLGDPVGALGEKAKSAAETDALVKGVAESLLNAAKLLQSKEMSHGAITPHNLYCAGGTAGLSCKLAGYQKVRFELPDYKNDMIGIGYTVFAAVCGEESAQAVRLGFHGKAMKVKDDVIKSCETRGKLTHQVVNFIGKLLALDKYSPAYEIKILERLLGFGLSDSEGAGGGGSAPPGSHKDGEVHIPGLKKVKDIARTKKCEIKLYESDGGSEKFAVKISIDDKSATEIEEECAASKDLQDESQFRETKGREKFILCTKCGKSGGRFYAVYPYAGKELSELHSHLKEETPAQRSKVVRAVATQLVTALKFLAANSISHGKLGADTVLCNYEKHKHHPEKMKCTIIDFDQMRFRRPDLVNDEIGVAQAVLHVACGEAAVKKVGYGFDATPEASTSELKKVCTGVEDDVVKLLGTMVSTSAWKDPLLRRIDEFHEMLENPDDDDDAGATAPGGAAEPASPAGPAGPPAEPASPASPAGPVGPPAEPASPAGPAGPPAEPASPASPASPAGPAGPPAEAQGADKQKPAENEAKGDGHDGKQTQALAFHSGVQGGPEEDEAAAAEPVDKHAQEAEKKHGDAGGQEQEGNDDDSEKENAKHGGAANGDNAAAEGAGAANGEHGNDEDGGDGKLKLHFHPADGGNK